MLIHCRIFPVKYPTLRILQNLFWSKRGFTCNRVIKADLAIIGTGPAGITAAYRAAQHGMRNIVVIDKYPLFGGTCVNHGCTPAKCLLKFSQTYKEAMCGFLALQGVITCETKLDMCKMMETKYQASVNFSGFMEKGLKTKEIQVLKGIASLCGCNKISVEGNDGQTSFVEAQNILIATGSVVRPFPGVEIDEEYILSSDGALELKKVPKRMGIIGAGIISIELGCIWSRLGSEVTIYTHDNIIVSPMLDADIREKYQKILENQGIRFVFGVKLQCATKCDKYVKFQISETKGKNNKEIECDVLLVAVGRAPYTCDLQLERVGILTNKGGYIPVNRCYQTCVPNIYAVGDVTPGPMTAHKAIEDGTLMVDGLCGRNVNLEVDHIPMVIYTHPEVACVGKSEEALRKEKHPYKVAVASFESCARAYTDLDTTGFIKALICEKTGRILGTHIIGRNAGEYINEAALAQQYGLTAEHVSRVAHAHPTNAKMLKAVFSNFL